MVLEVALSPYSSLEDLSSILRNYLESFSCARRISLFTASISLLRLVREEGVKCIRMQSDLFGSATISAVS